MVSCHIPMVTIIVDVEKFKGGNTNSFGKMGKYYTRPVCFTYSKVWFSNGIAEVPAC